MAARVSNRLRNTPERLIPGGIIRTRKNYKPKHIKDFLLTSNPLSAPGVILDTADREEVVIILLIIIIIKPLTSIPLQ